MARRSATESAAVLDVCVRLRLLDEERYTRGRGMLLEVVSMLVRMVSNLGEPEAEEEEGKGRGKGKGKEPEGFR